MTGPSWIASLDLPEPDHYCCEKCALRAALTSDPAATEGES